MKASFQKSKLHVSEHGLTCTQDDIRHYPVDGLKATEAQEIEPIQHLKNDSMVEFYCYDDDSEDVADLNKDGLKDITYTKKTLAKLYSIMPNEFKLTIK